MSVVALPDERTRDALAGVMAQAQRHAGPGHVETGRTDASHVTVRALEPYRHAAAPTDDITHQWVAALQDVAEASVPIRLHTAHPQLPTSTRPYGCSRCACSRTHRTSPAAHS